MTFNELQLTDADFAGKNIQSIGEDTVIGRAEELKRLFDAPAQEVLRERMNALLAYLQQTGAGSEIGTPEISEGSGTTVAEQLSYLLAQMQNISAGAVADGSIEDVKLSNAEGQIKDIVTGLKAYLFALTDAPENAVVRVDEAGLGYLRTERGALFAEEQDGAVQFDTLPVKCGGTYNKNLGNAPDGGIIVKRTSSAGEAYLGYAVTLPIENGGTGATTATAARSKLGAAAAEHTHTNEVGSFTLNTLRFGSGTATVQYSPVTKTCFLRVYCKTVDALAAGESYEVGTVSAAYKPSYTHALAHSCSKSAAVSINTEGKVLIRPREAIAAGYDNYISGFWFVG